MIGLHDLAVPVLRLFEPEDAHRLTIAGLKAGLGPRARAARDTILATTLAGLPLPNPLGLAAGFDKNAEVAGAMLGAGFGFVECGTTTPRPQAGNPRPRLFRLTEDRAVINRMGFNNAGHEAFARGLSKRPRRGIVGANVGANKDSQDRVADYVAGLKRMWTLADYFTLNISSPNTPGLRDLQAKSALGDLLGAVSAARADLTGAAGANRPVFLKVAPDLAEAEVGDIVEAAVSHGLDALIVSNTTTARPASLASPQRGETGGLSGAPLFEPSTAILRLFHAAAAGRIALIGAGGVGSGAQAYAKIRAGACAVQLYSALVFEGPSLAPRILDDLAARLRADGFHSVSEAVGTG
jgi:dihydroorotate dehydrogenase